MTDTKNSDSWLTVLEKQRTIIAWIIVVSSIVLLVFSARFNWFNYDSFWLLKTAQDWIESGLSPWKDHLSYTFYGETVWSPRWHFGAVYYGFVSLLGLDDGTYWLRLSAWLLTFGCMLVWMRQVKAPTIAYILALPLFVVALQQRPLIRPEILSYPFILISLMLYERARHQVSWRTMVPIAALMTLWTNFHSSVFGWVIFFGLFADIGYRLLTHRASLKEWSHWLAWGLVVLATGFINPYFYHEIIGLFSFSEEWSVLIKEYEPPVKYFSFGYFPALVFAGLLALFLAVRQRKIGYLVTMVILIKFAMTTSRLVTPVTLFCMAALAHMLSDIKLDQLSRQWTKPGRLLAALTLVICFSMTITHSIKMAYVMATEDLVPEKHPDHAVAYMKANDKYGKIFNEYRIGGYLAYKLAPDSKVFIDGRTAILYPLEFMKRYNRAKISAAELYEIYQEFGFDYVIQKDSQRILRNLVYIGFELDFADTDYVLFQPENGSLTTFGLIWALPYCWSSEMEGSLRRESSVLDEQSSPESEIRALDRAVMAMIDAPSTTHFLQNFGTNSETPDPVVRFITYRALEIGLTEVALESLKFLKQRDYKDYQALTMAFISDGQFSAALETQKWVINAQVGDVEFTDLVVQEAQLQAIRAEVPLDSSTQAYLDNLTQTVGKHSLSVRGQILGVSAMCDSNLIDQ